MHYAPEVPQILVGTKLDLKTDANVLRRLGEKNMSPITFEMGQRMAEEIDAVAYVECSALTQYNLKEVFDTAIRTVLNPPRPIKKKPVKGSRKRCVLF